MPTNSLYHTWFHQIRRLRPSQRITQVRNFVADGWHSSKTLGLLEPDCWQDPRQSKVVEHRTPAEPTAGQRLSRLTLAVAILYVWLVSVGAHSIRSGLRHLVDRAERRDLCIFQIGLRSIERCLTNALHYNIRLCSYH
jgi:hypothetical protein